MRNVTTKVNVRGPVVIGASLIASGYFALMLTRLENHTG